MFEIERRSGRIPEPPQILLDYGANIEIDYLGPLAQAQKRMFKTQVIRAGIESVGMAANVWPEARHVIDPIKTMRDLLDSQGFPAKDYRTDDEIDEILAQEAQQRQAEEMVEGLPKVAKGISALTKGAQPASPMEMITGQSSEGKA
jgi:hypothetical protein